MHNLFFHPLSLIHISHYRVSEILINDGCITGVDFFSRFFLLRAEFQKRERSVGESAAIKLTAEKLSVLNS